MPDEHLERLLAELGERAQAEIAQVHTDATSRAAAIRCNAAAQADARRLAALQALEADLAHRTMSALADARRQARGTVLRAQHALVDRVLARARALVIEHLADPASDCGITRRAEVLRSYAMTSDAAIERGDAGIRLAADAGHLSIDDTVDAWLDADRGAIAIEVCQAVEASPC